MIIYTPAIPTTRVPVIDFADASSGSMDKRHAVAFEVHKACREVGFFYIANHGVASSQVEAMFHLSRRFFDLPLDLRMALDMRNSPSSAGYEPMGAQTLDSQDTDSEKAPPDLKESFYCGQELPDDHPLSLRRIRGYGHNQWPHALPELRAGMTAYYMEMLDLGRRILAMLALSLELEEEYFVEAFAVPPATLRLIKYPPHRSDAHFNQIGAGAHTDWGGVTILAQDSSGGLEVRNLNGQWLEAPPIADTFVINIGDLMARWTNDIYKSNMHRVKNNRSGADRYSIPFFMSPQPEVRIEALPGCVTDGQPALHAPCSAAEHMREMFQRSYGYAAATGG